MAIRAEALNSDQVTYIPVNSIRSNPYQPRKVFEKAPLLELADSIKEYGVMQPISVRKNGEKYELVAGERRLRASKLAGKETIPAFVIDISERDSAFLALMENLQRENLNFLEEAEGYLNLMRDYGMTQEEVAQKLGKSQSNIANKIRILKLPEEIKLLLRDSGLTERHGRALLKLPRDTQLLALRKIIAEGMNVKKTDDYVERILKKRPSPMDVAAQQKKDRRKYYIKDTRIYTNTVKNAVELINEMGGNAMYTIAEKEDRIEISVVIKRT